MKPIADKECLCDTARRIELSRFCNTGLTRLSKSYKQVLYLRFRNKGETGGKFGCILEVENSDSGYYELYALTPVEALSAVWKHRRCSRPKDV